jgi:hypothetical protein
VPDGFGRKDLARVPTLHFNTTQSGQTARKYLGTSRTVKRRRVRVDGRTRCWQQVKYKVAQYSRALGDHRAKDPLTKARIVELAELEVLTAEMRARGLRGEDLGSFDLQQLSRFTNSIARLRAGLGLVEPPAPALDLDALLAAE